MKIYFLIVKVKDHLYMVLRFTKDLRRLIIDFIVASFRMFTKERFVRGPTCHFLICKDLKYISVSKFAIISFIRFHPDYYVKIHCDESTYATVSNLWKYFPWLKIEVEMDIKNNLTPYVSKGLLILKLQGSADSFLDVDTRVNSRIPKLDVPTVLVAEHCFGEKEEFVGIFREMGISDKIGLQMLNVSFVSWGGKNLNLSEKEFLEWSDRYLNLPWESLVQKKHVKYYQRFVEQIFFSLHFQTSHWLTIKEQDRVADKGIIESTYFGATGHRFGR